jgi:hypothetical protein
VFQRQKVFYRNRIHSVTVGVYTGLNANAFQMWLNNELNKLKLPVFTCSLMELEFQKNDTSISGVDQTSRRDVKADGVYQYILNSAK